MKKVFINSIRMSENESSAGLVSMPTLQYNEEGWGPHEISEDFRVMPYQVIAAPFPMLCEIIT